MITIDMVTGEMTQERVEQDQQSERIQDHSLSTTDIQPELGLEIREIPATSQPVMPESLKNVNVDEFLDNM